MLPGLEQLACPELAVPASIMQHVVAVESSYNPYAIGVVGGRLARQPSALQEAVATAHMLEAKGYNFSLGLAQVNRYNLRSQGLDSYEKAFGHCANLRAGARILADCHTRAKGDWGKAFSCYYSGNFSTGFKHGYVQKVFASMQRAGSSAATAVPLAGTGAARRAVPSTGAGRARVPDPRVSSRVQARVDGAHSGGLPRRDDRRASAQAVPGAAPLPTATVTNAARAAMPSTDGDAPVMLRPYGAASAAAPAPSSSATRQPAAPTPLEDPAFVF